MWLLTVNVLYVSMSISDNSKGYDMTDERMQELANAILWHAPKREITTDELADNPGLLESLLQLARHAEVLAFNVLEKLDKVDERDMTTPKQAHERIYRLLRTPRTAEVKNELKQLSVDYPEVYEAARQVWLDGIPF